MLTIKALRIGITSIMEYVTILVKKFVEVTIEHREEKSWKRLSKTQL